MKFTSSFLKKEAGTYIGFFALVFVVVFWSLSIRASNANNSLYDVIRTTGERKEVVIVGIDDKSLQFLGAWPWDRSVFARLQEALDSAEVRATLYDVLFFEPRRGDEAFLEKIHSSQSPVVLASKLERIEYLSSYLISDGAATNTLSSLANVAPDRDGKVRAYPEPVQLEGKCLRGLGETAFLLYTLRMVEGCEKRAAMFRYPDSIATYSLIDVLEGSVGAENLKSKVVFIGSSVPDLGDNFVGIYGNKIPGVYVHASVFVSLLNSVRDKELSPLMIAVTVVSLMLFAALLAYRIQTVARQLVAVLLLIAGISTLSVILFSYGLQVPILSYMISILLSSGYVVGIGFMKERQENAHIQSLFSKYVHKDVLKELISSGTDIKLGGEKKDVSILFSDIRGFTSLSENLSPEDLTMTLNAYLSSMMPEILEEKGTIDKFIGDAIMAFWNAPLSTSDHPLHAVRAALRMQSALEKFNQEKGTSLAIGVGIHTGTAVVGNIGGKDHVSYTVLGDTVNLASRLEGLTKKYGVRTVVTKAVRDTIMDDSIAFRCLDVITVLGKARPTTLYEARKREDFEEGFIDDYEKAFKHYYDKEWVKAERLLKKLAKTGDAPSRVLLSRIPEIRKKVLWDGVWRWDEK